MLARFVRRLAFGASLAAVAMLAGTVTPALAAPVLKNVTASVDVDGQGTASVQLRYRVSAADKPAGSLTFSSLRFGDAKAEDLVIRTAAGQPLDVDTEQVKLKTVVTASLDSPIEAGEQTELLVRYTVPGAAVVDGDRMTVNTPVLVLDDPAATTTRGTFTAEVLLPPGYRYVEGFPANPEKVASTGDRTRIRYDTPAAVSLLRVESASGKVPWWTLGTSANLALAVTLVVGAIALYLSFTRRRRRAAQIAATGSIDENPGDQPAGNVDGRH